MLNNYLYIDIILLFLSMVFFVISFITFFYFIKNKRINKKYEGTYNTEEIHSTTLSKTLKNIQDNNIKTDIDYDQTEILYDDMEQRYTELLFDNTSNNYNSKRGMIGFDLYTLEGKYKIIKELDGGGMSKVFLGENTKLGNKWIIKFVPKIVGELTNEEEILKRLNHISLPKIVDIFRDSNGLYIVESYIEGVALDKVINSKVVFTQSIILDWAFQISQVLNYLHKNVPQPIYHLDIKPSNFIVTHDNRLVLIDFGISKLGTDDLGITGATYKYCAPEQVGYSIPNNYSWLIEKRFGQLPTNRSQWRINQKTDIFSFGTVLFELLIGDIPTKENYKKLTEYISKDFSNIIYKCININPEERYNSVEEILVDLNNVNDIVSIYEKSLISTKFGSIFFSFSFILFLGSLSTGIYTNKQEKESILDIKPQIIFVSEQQTSDFKIKKTWPNGASSYVDNDKIIWEDFNDNIARIDGNRIIGINAGETYINGKYRNKIIKLEIKVVEPIEDLVDISLHYESDHKVSIFTGTKERERVNGDIAIAEFVSPESMDISKDGTIYVSDSGVIRKITNNQVKTVEFEPSYITAKTIRCYDDDLYILTNAWQDNGVLLYGIIMLNENGAEMIYFSDANYTTIEDMVFSDNGILYFVENNSIFDDTYLKSIDLKNPEDIKTITEISSGVVSIAIDGEDRIYLADEVKGVIYLFEDDKINYFAGVENEKAFIDGNAPLFYMPQNIKYYDDYLYVWDFNVIRRIKIDDGVAKEVETMVGFASSEFDMNIYEETQNIQDIILPNSRLTDFFVDKGEIFISDPKRGVIWKRDK